MGDLLSCHTALFDWRLASNAGRGRPWDEEVAAVGRRVLDEVEAALPEIAAVSEEGVRFLARTHQLVGATCVAAGHPLFEEGSEHFLAYVFEWLTREHRVHGELLSFCVLAMSSVQENDPDRAIRIVRGSKVEASPEHLGIDGALFARMFAELPGYCEREGLYPSVVETVELTPRLAAAAFERARGAVES